MIKLVPSLLHLISSTWFDPNKYFLSNKTFEKLSNFLKVYIRK